MQTDAMHSSDEGDDILSETPSPGGVAASDSQNTQPSSKALLSKEDLERHFAYGLKEAAQRLGVCNTTLKRACR